MARFLLQWMEVEQKYRLRKKLDLTCNKTIEKQAFRRIIVELVYLPFVCKHVVKAYFWSVYVLFNVVDRNFSILFAFSNFWRWDGSQGRNQNTASLSFFLPYFLPKLSSIFLCRRHNFVPLSWHNIFLHNFPGIIFLYSKYNPRLCREIPVWNFMKKSIRTHFIGKLSYRETFGFRFANILDGFIIILVLP